MSSSYYTFQYSLTYSKILLLLEKEGYKHLTLRKHFYKLGLSSKQVSEFQIPESSLNRRYAWKNESELEQFQKIISKQVNRFFQRGWFQSVDGICCYYDIRNTFFRIMKNKIENESNLCLSCS